MFKRILVIFMALAAAAFMSGCSTLADARSAKGTGTPLGKNVTFCLVVAYHWQ